MDTCVNNVYASTFLWNLPPDASIAQPKPSSAGNNELELEEDTAKPFENPYTTDDKTSALQFENGYLDPFINSYSNELPSSFNFKSNFSTRLQRMPLPYQNGYSNPWQIANPEDSNPAPFSFFLSRHKITSTTLLCDPKTNNPVYRICPINHNISYPWVSDLQISRCVPTETLVGLIHMGAISVTTTSAVCARRCNQIYEIPNGVLPEEISPTTLIWKRKQFKRRKIKYRWSTVHPNRLEQVPSDDPLLVLELVEKDKQQSSPLCVVKLHHTMPLGQFEFWATGPWMSAVNGDWAAMDELVLSAYANLERARYGLTTGFDTTGYCCGYRTDSWTGMLLRLLVGILALIAMGAIPWGVNFFYYYYGLPQAICGPPDFSQC